MFQRYKSVALGAAISSALILGAGAASALTFGTIPGGTSKNDGIEHVYGPGTTSVDGYYGGTLALLGSNADIKIEFFGAEASRTNEFWFEGIKRFTTSGVAGSWDTTGAGSVTVTNVAVGVLDFLFDYSRDVPPPTTPDQVVNGSNPDGSGPGSPANFFVTFGDSAATSGQVVDLWFDDGGAGPDDNHDDMAIRLSITDGTFSVVPVPASVPLLLTALGGLGYMARRKRKSA
jgi:hypothetical protein